MPFVKHTLLGAALAALCAVPTPGEAAETRLNGHLFTLPAGFEIELVARAPLVDRPISLAMDDLGRLYVTDSSGSSDKGPTQYERKDHRVVRLEDTDGDGRFDKSLVFADRMMFPEGALFHGGSLYVAAPPQIWKLTDTDHDGVADRREVWFDGKTLTGCANDLHGPFLGRDGWIYWAKGAFAQQTYTLEGGKPFSTRAAHLFRARPDGTGIEPVMTGGMDNPVDIAFSAGGERFFSTTFFQNPAGGRRDGLIHAIYGGVYGKPHDVLDGHARTGELMPVLVHMGAAAPCGLATYDSVGMGDDWRGNLLACYFNLRKVVRHELLPEGATFRTRDTDLLASDHVDFHPTDVHEDADGSILIVDTGGWYKICCPTSQLAKADVLGAIYRIRRRGMARAADPRGLSIAWAQRTPVELTALLDDARPAVQQRAIAELGARGDAGVTALSRIVGRGEADRSRVQAVWALTRIEGEAARRAVRAAITRGSDDTRLAAIHSAALWRDRAAAPQLLSALGSTGAVARAAAEALGRMGDEKAVPRLLAAAEGVAQAPDGAARRVLEHSLTYALIEIGRPAAVRTALQRALPAAQREAVRQGVGTGSTQELQWRMVLIALDQMPGGELKPEEVLPLLASPRPGLKATATWIVEHRPEWGGALAGQLGKRLADESSNPAAMAELELLLTRLAPSPAVQDLLASSLVDDRLPDACRGLVLRAMGAAGLRETPPRWHAALLPMLATAKGELLRGAVATARALPPSKPSAAEMGTALTKVGRQMTAPAPVRLDALAAAPALDEVEGPLFHFLQSHLDPGSPLLSRAAAAQVLAKAKLSPGQLLELAARMKTVGPLEAPRLLPAFERSPSEPLGLILVAALKQSSGLRGLRADLLRPLLAKYPPRVREAAEGLVQALHTDAAAQAARLDALLAKWPVGDVRRGQVVYLSTKAACSACHAQGYLGGRLGPDLTNLGKVRTDRDLLESIIFPSASFVRSYESFSVATHEGEEVTGILRKDGPDEVVLATGPESEARIPRGKITGMRPGVVSLMPAGMDGILSTQELADLIAFLRAPR